ncbi:E3 ubiquitin-protein ligase UBR2-like isoform X1 [Ictalurus punctatus]|uniref:E3 ubiquitin-protein ligase n=1 Tax=Ictalurus punctatus TaxID=7998 RepID=A0A9F7TJ46_ICTPU|nr:E3 ubiquitin-protein ligase UBR2-like isoform X1 [Ictalurus punctatus]XP_053534796.1 E3 ubiquitin-protein ligase UBR2-like isoform X1 [Ictalurus punctatus]XP_053534797.1 E3 ubiquitin-protein ligase UBR2-like isoform X1 [Ictalurus punctatus]
MAQTLESQSHFINKYIDLLTQDSEDLDASASTSAEHSPSSCDSALVCVGPRRWRARGGERRQMEMRILCHEAQEILPDGTTMVLAAFVQRSTVMSKNRKRPPHNAESCDPLFMHPDLSFGTHTGSCGHVMHSHCWQRSLNINDANREEKYNRTKDQQSEAADRQDGYLGRQDATNVSGVLCHVAPTVGRLPSCATKAAGRQELPGLQLTAYVHAGLRHATPTGGGVQVQGGVCVQYRDPARDRQGDLRART